MDGMNGLGQGGVTARNRMTLPMAALLFLVLGACCVVLAACGDLPGFGSTLVRGDASPLATPAYYVFESVTIDGDTIYDPSELFLDRQGETEGWYYLTIAIHNEREGRLCTDGRLADFTYRRSGDTIVLDVPLGFGFDGARLKLGEGTLTMGGGSNKTVLRLVDEAPAAALAAR